MDAGLSERFLERAGLAAGDLFVAVIGYFHGADVSPETGPPADGALDALRRHLGNRLNVRQGGEHHWIWVTDFPLFEWDAEAGRLNAAHHAFTMPHADDLPRLIERTQEAVRSPADAAAIYRMGLRSRAYDAVYNGMEMASGSIRIHDPRLQQHIFRALGMPEDEAERRFGFLLEAFRFGAPPHGGFAFGFDRMVMLLVGATSLRDVIAFPKTTAARALFEGAPSWVPPADLRELHITTLDAEGA
jgi:aspartyl-tRNA synthetase